MGQAFRIMNAQDNTQREDNSLQGELEGLRDKLSLRLEASLRRRAGKLRKLSAALDECANEEKYRRWGELLKASLSMFGRGQDKVKVIDYYTEGQPEIEIDISREKTPLENMEVYFKRARKLRNGRPRIEIVCFGCQFFRD